MDASFVSKRSYVIGLSLECPLGRARESCPLNLIRQHPTHDRFRMIKHMTRTRLDEIIDSHHACFEDRKGFAERFEPHS